MAYRPKIAFVSQPEYFRSMYEHDLDGFADVLEFPFHFSMSQEDLRPLVEYAADMNFFFRGEYVPDAVLKALPGAKIAFSSEPFPREINGHVEYTRDSLNRYLYFRSIRTKPFDYVFHYDAASLDYMRRDGLRLSGSFAFPIATGLYRPEDKPDKRWDIFFIGRSTDHRERYFGPLKHYYNFLHIAHGIWGAELVRYINSARIALNAHAESEISWEARLQMMLACRAFVISEPVTPNPYLRPNVDYIEVSSPARMFDVVSYYLKHDREREEIAANGYQRVLDCLSSPKVFPAFVSDLRNGSYPRFAASRGTLSLDTLTVARNTVDRLQYYGARIARRVFGRTDAR